MLQLHRRGKIEEWELQRMARDYIFIYAKNDTCLVPFKDVAVGRVRFVKFLLIDGNWLFVDLTD